MSSKCSERLRMVSAVRRQPLRATRARDFDAALEAAQAAIVSGEAEKFLRQQKAGEKAATELVIPVQPETEDPLADYEKVGEWITSALQPWWAALPSEVQKAAPKQLYYLEKEKKIVAWNRVKAWLAEKLQSSSFDEASTSVKEALTSFRSEVQELLSKLPWAWQLAAAHDLTISELCEPTTEAAAQIPEEKLIRWLLWYTQPWMGKELLRRYPTPEGKVTLFKDGILHPSGEFKKAPTYTAQFYGQSISPEPDPGGWYDTKLEKYFEPKVYLALVRLQEKVRGAVYVGEVASHFTHHSAKGYPIVEHGGSHTHWEMPIWRPQEGEGWLAEQLADIQTLKSAGYPVPEDALWMNVQLGQTKAGNPRLEPVWSGQQAVSGTFHFVEMDSISRGKWGWEGEIDPATKAVGGARVLATMRYTSNGGGARSYKAVYWLPVGGQVNLASGKALLFDGQEVKTIAGGALKLEDDPSRQ